MFLAESEGGACRSAADDEEMLIWVLGGSENALIYVVDRGK